MQTITFEQLLTRAHLPEAAADALLAAKKTLPAYISAVIEEGVAAYQKDTFFDYEAYRGKLAVGEQAELWQLLFAFRLAEHLHTLYIQAGRSQQLFDGVLQDFCAKTRECFDYTGKWGCHVAKWFRGWFRLERIALSRLQFELRPFGYCYRGLKPEDQAINVHIPSTGPLDAAMCEADYAAAAEFFGSSFTGSVVFMCHSWLLNPHHPEFLPPTSRLLKFQEKYDIFEFQQSTEFLWRLFGTAYNGDPHSLTERNSLERAYKNRLLSGGAVGEGRGVFFYSK